RCFAALALIALTACSEAPLVTAPPAAPSLAKATSLYFATTRQKEQGQFGSTRLDEPTFGRMTISIPTTSLLERDPETGRILNQREALAGFPNPQGPDLSSQYAVLANEPVADRPALVARLRAEIEKNRARAAAQAQGTGEPPREQGVTVFVHGFNTPFGNAVYRLAQFTEDFDFSGSRGTIPVLYAWPSRGRLTAYLADRESVLLEEMHLEELLEDIAAINPDFISIVAHSMGAQLAMQTLRRVSVRGNTALLEKIQPVFLLAPDIDVEVFRNQVKDMGSVRQPFLVLASRKDLALRFSALIRGGSERLGRAGKDSPVLDLPIAVIDATELNDGNLLGHDLGFTSDTLIELVACVGRFDQFARMPDQEARYIALSPSTEDRRRLCDEVTDGMTAPAAGG
ncbi:MAG: alpha/beta fold hydrolase, partial [Pseudomonadota bacterium]